MENSQRLSHFLRFWLAVYLYAAAIFVLSSLPQLGKLPGPRNIDKICHLFEYTGFGYLLARAFKNSVRGYLKVNFQILAIGCAILYALTDEIHQAFVPLRNPSIVDLLFDGFGATLGSILFWKRDRLIRRSNRNG